MQDSFSDLPEDQVPRTNPAQAAISPTLQNLLITAIYEKRLGELLHENQQKPLVDLNTTDQTVIAKALATILQINAEIDEHCMDMQARLTEAGVETIRAANSTGFRQFHAFELEVERGKLATALEVLKNVQYPLAAALSSGAIAAIDATEGKLELMQDVENDMRLILSCDRDGPAARLPFRLRPTLADYLAVRLPSSLWPIYFAINRWRAVRGRLRRLIGEKPQDAHVTVLSHVNLGTPRSLVAPLLEVAGLSQDDTLVDFGCGDGRIIAQAMRDYNCEVLGIEPNALLAEIARQSISSAPIGQSQVKNRFGTPRDVADASVVFLFQPMPLAVKLLPALLAQMKPGGRIIIHEQSALHLDLKPTYSTPVFSKNAMTIAHIWCV